MKVVFYVLVSTCLISGFRAVDLSAFEDNFDLASDSDETLVHHDDGVKILWPTTADPKVTRPTTTQTKSTEPSTSEPTTEPTTTTITTTTVRPRPTHPPHPTPTPTSTHRPLPTRPPRPSTTSFRPLPPPRPSPAPLPIVNRPQIYNNKVNSMKPFASYLVNVVLNKGGKQKTIQKNQIFYNIRNRPAPKLMNEEESIF